MTNRRNLANVNVGSAANDGTGDLLRDAFIKINDNFANIFGNGQFLANVTDNRGAPGYSWEDDRNTGLYNPEDGVIIVSLNGVDSLQMRSNGTILWRDEPLVTRNDLTNITGGGGGALEVVPDLPQSNNFDGRFVLNLQDNLLYLYQNGAWEEMKYKIQTGIDFVNVLPPAAESYQGRMVIYSNAVWIYKDNVWTSIKNLADIEEDYSKIEVVTATTLPTTDNFQGRTCWFQSELYIYLSGGWRKYSDYINIQQNGSSVELAGSIKLWAGSNAPDGWAICDGRAISRTTYATLFTRIGTTYGNGDGSSTFNIPDFRDRTAFGVSATKSIGGTGGFADAAIISHTHTATNIVTDPGHNHVPGNDNVDNEYNQAVRKANPATGTIQYSDAIAYPQPDLITSGPISKATTGISVTTTIAAPANSVATTNRNLPPYVTVNWIIKLDDSATTQSGGGGSSGPYLFYTVTIFKRSPTTPPGPTGGSFDFGNLTVNPPATWYNEIPAGTDPVWISRALATGSTPTDVDSTLNWSVPVVGYRDGVTQTVTQTGDPGPRNATGYLYYNTPTDPNNPPNAPTASGYNFDTGQFSSLTSGWSVTPTAPAADPGKRMWAVRYNVSEAQVFGGTQTTVLSSVFVWQNFDGVVTFSNYADAFENNITTIDGDKIDTGTLSADTIKTGTTSSFQDGEFGFGVGTAVYGIPAIGYFKSSVDGVWPLITVHDAGGSNDQSHGFASTTNALNSWSGLFYQFDNYNLNNTFLYAHGFIAGQKQGASFGRYADWATDDRSAAIFNTFGGPNQVPAGNYAVDNRFRSSLQVCTNSGGLQSEFYDQPLASRTIPTYQAILTGALLNPDGSPTGFEGALLGASANPAQNAIQNATQICGGGWDLICYTGTAYIPGGVTTFTGVHEGVMDDPGEAQPGDIVIDDEVVHRLNISNVRFKQILSSQANQKGVIGVISRIFTTEETEKRRQDAINRENATYYRDKKVVGDTGELETDEQYEAALEIESANFEKLKDKVKQNSNWIPPENVQILEVNAVGEGQINVCGEGGNIERGDLIVTSSIPGKGMKQADDIVRAYTVAKARESVTFASNTEVKTIACVYLCG